MKQLHKIQHFQDPKNGRKKIKLLTKVVTKYAYDNLRHCYRKCEIYYISRSNAVIAET